MNAQIAEIFRVVNFLGDSANQFRQRVKRAGASPLATDGETAR
jgi:hypothetical protein